MSHKFIFDIDLLAIIEAFQVQSDDVLKLANLDNKLFQGKKTELSAEQYFNLCISLESITQDQELSLKLGQSVTTDLFNPTIIAALSSENLRQALQRLNEFKILCAPIKLNISKEGSGLKYEIRSYDDQLQVPPVLSISELVFLTYLARLGTAKQIAPTNVTTVSPLKSSDSFQAYFGVATTIGQEHSISFSDAVLDTPFESRNDFIWTFYEPILRNKLAWIGAETSYENRVKSKLIEMLPSGKSSLSHIANILALSERSLQRHLQKENTNYQMILSTIRHELSSQYLVNSEIPSSQIAYLLGFKDANSFYRAFNQWQGQSPEEYRRNTQAKQL